MQPIAINIKVLSKLISAWREYDSQLNFYLLCKNLKNYHTITIDKQKYDSEWLTFLYNLREDLKDDNIKKIIEDLLLRGMKYEIVEIADYNDLFLYLVHKTPDKIGLDETQCVKEDLALYDLESFNNTNYNKTNFLFRIPKNITFKCNDYISERLFIPYLRKSEKIEFCDRYLFSLDGVSETDFLISLLSQCTGVKEIVFHCNPNPLNKRQKDFEKKLKKALSNKPKLSFILYNRKKNHDRFIIVDDDKYSIRFSNSFNNIIQKEGRFIAKKSFNIDFSTGRYYID